MTKDINDYNSGYTVGKTPTDEINFKILLRRDRFLDALEQYHEYKFQKAHFPMGKVRSKLNTLFQTVRTAFCNDNEKDEVIILKQIESGEYEDLMKAWHRIDGWLDEKGITTPDPYKKYDRGNIEEESKRKGF